MLGVLSQRGAYYVFEELSLGRGMINAIEYLNNNKEILDKIIDMCYNRIPITKEEKGSEDEQED